MATYITRENRRFGPFDDIQVLAALGDGTYLPDDLAWRDGMTEWEPLRNLYSTPTMPPPLASHASVAKGSALGDDAGLRLLLPVGRSGWAIAAGYLGLFSLIVIPAPLALLISVVAIRDIRKSKSSEHPKHGMGRAIFGLIMGVLGTVILLGIVVTWLSQRH